MTFKDVVFKNLKGSFRKYLAYFLSCSFSILLFFMYSTLIMNKVLMERDDTDVLSYVFPITMVSIALFSIFFINYAHSAFMKGRNKEFGIYISLGVTSKELRKLINMESMIIGSVAIIIGTGVGALFSRLFQMVILSLLSINDIRFYLDYRPFLLTFIVFFFIFTTVLGRTSIRMSKVDISSLLREARRTEGKDYTRKDLLFGGLGFSIMAFSIVFLVYISGHDDLNSNPIVLMSYMLTAFLGVYLTLSNGGNLLIHFLKRGSCYYKNMLSITELHYKFNQNRKIIFILSVLSTMTIFLVASPFSLFSLSETLAEMAKNHLEYTETRNINSLSVKALEKILDDQKVKSSRTIRFIYLSTKKNSNALTGCVPVMSAKEYNKLTGGNIELSEGEALNYIIDWYPGNYGIEPGSIHELYNGSAAYSFRFQDSRRGNWIAEKATFGSSCVVIINDVDYTKIADKITDQNVGYYHLINFKNWKKSRDVVIKLRAALGDSELKTVYIYDTYEQLRSGYSVFLFASTVMGIMFFVAGGSVLYFKQFTELSEAKATFRKLFKIGITDKEMRNIIGKELFVVFFLPLLFGTFLGVSLIYLMTHIVGGEAIIGEFMQNAMMVVVIYFISQGAFYLITKNRYIAEIVKG